MIFGVALAEHRDQVTVM